jgi:hypothetical protein
MQSRCSFLKNLAFAFGLSLIAWNAAAQNPDFPKHAELREIRKVSVEILKRCPPAECIVIGIGRSPAVFTADLQNQAEDYAYNVPVSGFRHNPDFEKMQPLDLRETLSESMFHPLDPSREAYFFEHLSGYLPNTQQIKGRRMLLIDYAANGGYSLFSFQRYAEKFYRSMGSEPKINSLAIANFHQREQVRKTAPRYGVKDTDVLELEAKSELAESLDYSMFEHLAEYPKYLLNDKPHQLKKNPAYEELKSRLRGYTPQIRDISSDGRCLQDVFSLLK